MMSELKQIRISSLKSVILCIFASGIESSFVKPYFVHPSGFKSLKTDK
jgi:hypothetical protein